MKRLGVFVFYDPQGVVDDYVLYLLGAVRSVCTEMVTVCNGKLTDEGRERLSQYSDAVFCRENQGMDAGALKDYFTHLGRREHWSAFDELVWFNDTCYGPLCSMEGVFQEMEQREPCDFWGITLHARSDLKWPGSKTGGIPEHLQSYFLVVKQPLLRDDRFFRFWQDMEVSDNFNATVANYELSLTRTFSSWGYRYDAFCRTGNRDTNPEYVCNLTAEAMYTLVARYGCPLVKRKNFIRTNAEATIHTNGEQVFRTMQYIRKHGLYDTSLIYRNLMRLYPQSLWHGNLCHKFVLSAEHAPEEPLPTALILAEADHEDTVLELAGHLDTLSENCKLVVLTRTAELVAVIKSHLPPCSVKILPERSEGLASMFMVLRQMEWKPYACICLLQENWGAPSNGFHIPESSVRSSLYGNLVEGSHFVQNILRAFRDNPLLGLMEPPQFPQNINAVPNYRKSPKEYAQKYGISLPAQVEEAPLFCQPSAWCRREVVSEVLKSTGASLPRMEKGSLESLISYIALSGGFYCAEVMEAHWAANLMANQEEIVSSACGNWRDLKYMRYRRLFQMAAAINSGRLKPQDADVTPFMLLKLTFATGLYYVEKRICRHVSQKKKNTFFLGVRDVFHAFQRKMASRRG